MSVIQHPFGESGQDALTVPEEARGYNRLWKAISGNERLVIQRRHKETISVLTASYAFYREGGFFLPRPPHRYGWLAWWSAASHEVDVCCPRWSADRSFQDQPFLGVPVSGRQKAYWVTASTTSKNEYPIGNFKTPPRDENGNPLKFWFNFSEPQHTENYLVLTIAQWKKASPLVFSH